MYLRSMRRFLIDSRTSQYMPGMIHMIPGTIQRSYYTKYEVPGTYTSYGTRYDTLCLYHTGIRVRGTSCLDGLVVIGMPPPPKHTTAVLATVPGTAVEPVGLREDSSGQQTLTLRRPTVVPPISRVFTKRLKQRKPTYHIIPDQVRSTLPVPGTYSPHCSQFCRVLFAEPSCI